MKKTFKLVALLIALCMVLSVVLVACKDNKCKDGHTDANHDGVCDVCGQTGLDVNHTGGTATCQKKAVCTVCGKEYGELADHIWDNPNASCKETVTCTVCKLTQSGFHKDKNRDKKCDICGTVVSNSTYSFNTYAASFPNYWNPLDYQTNDASSMISYGASGFYEFDFKFDADGNVIDGQFEIKPVMAAGLPEDVTSQYVGEKWGITSQDKERAWKITLRNDLCWDDGTPITPASFAYSLKEQLNPLFKPYRADSYYNSTTVIHNAKDYFFQGEKGWYDANTPYREFEEGLEDALIFQLGPANETTGNARSYYRQWFFSYMGLKASQDQAISAETVADYTIKILEIDDITKEDIVALEGKTWKEIHDDPTMLNTFTVLLTAWQTDPGEELHFFVTEYTWPKVNFEDVGLITLEEENAVVVILDTSISWGTNGYHFAYEFGLPLVKEDIYEANKVKPQEGATLWTSTYGTSVETSPSYGPYKLTVFEPGKQYVFERNYNWWGWNMEEYDNKYQTDRIVCNWIAKWETAWMDFQKGELDAIGIDVSIADTYKTSSQAYFTASDFVGSLQIQSEKDVLVNADDGNAKELLLNVNFRKAISLAFNRAEFTATCTTSSKPGFGLFNSMHYYDVEHGLRYRDEDVTKRIICEVYGVDVDSYPTLDDAYEAVTGFNLTVARQLVQQAIKEELEKGTIKESDKLELTLGDAEKTTSSERVYTFFNNTLISLLEGSKFGGSKFTLNYDATHGDDYANHFRQGQYEFLFAGWSGAAWNPFYFLNAYISPSYRYATGWEVDDIELEITVKSFDFGNGSHTKTLFVMDWLSCINGYSDGSYNMGESNATIEDRLIVAAALEKCVLESYYSIPLYNSFSAALRSYKVKAVTNNYHTFMGWGGVEYYTYNYDDAAWAAFVASQGGTLDYNK